MIRRYLILAALAATIAAGAIVSVTRHASAQSGAAELVPAVQSAGPITVDGSHSILIGLLLPAVQRVREAATHAFFVDGTLVATVPIRPAKTTSQTLFDVTYTGFADGSVRLVIKQRGSEKPLYVSGPVQGPSQVAGVLLPAVQSNDRQVRALSASAQIIGPEGNLVGILPYIQQRPSGGN